MKLTKRQLNKIIAESLGIQSRVITEAVNFRKIRKDLFALKADIDNQALLDKVSDHADKLKAKVDAGDSKFFKGRYQEAVTLLASLEELLKAPTPEKIDDVTEEPIIEDPPEPTPEPTEPEPTPWKPDPDPKVGWEYQVRECIWYTRKKKTTKEYKLGHASGKPLEKGGKFFNSIVSLNNAYPDLVKDCDPVKKKKKKKTTKEGLTWPDNAINLIKTAKIPGQEDLTGIPEWKNAFQGACSNYLSTNGLSLTQFYQGMNPGIKFTGVFEWLALEETQGGRAGRDVAEALIDEVNDMSKEVSGKTKGLNNHSPDSNPLSGDNLRESLSRGALYRRRYYGRY
jgi:hypothetical protein